MSLTMRQILPRKTIQQVKKLIDQLNTEEIMLVKSYVEDRLDVDITFTAREHEPPPEE